MNTENRTTTLYPIELGQPIPETIVMDITNGFLIKGSISNHQTYESAGIVNEWLNPNTGTNDAKAYIANTKGILTLHKDGILQNKIQINLYANQDATAYDYINTDKIVKVYSQPFYIKSKFLDTRYKWDTPVETEDGKFVVRTLRMQAQYFPRPPKKFAPSEKASIISDRFSIVSENELPTHYTSCMSMSYDAGNEVEPKDEFIIKIKCSKQFFPVNDVNDSTFFSFFMRLAESNFLYEYETPIIDDIIPVPFILSSGCVFNFEKQDAYSPLGGFSCYASNTVENKALNISTEALLQRVVEKTNAHTNTLNKPISDAMQQALDNKSNIDHTHDDRYYTEAETDTKFSQTNAALTVHTENLNNPHQVTKTQLGLDQVDNTADQNKPVSAPVQAALEEKSNIGHGHDDRYYTQAETDEKVSAMNADIIGHVNNMNNPHHITKAQLTLDQVDNTSDINKPISISTQNALNMKVDKETGRGLSANDYTTIEKNKLADIEDGANNYSHPAAHPASIITQDNTHQFVTSNEKINWNNKLSADDLQGGKDINVEITDDGLVIINHTQANSNISYGVCETALTVNNKTVSASGFSLQTGAMCAVQFKYGLKQETYSTTLNINNTGEKEISWGSYLIYGDYGLHEGVVLLLVYDGTNYQLVAPSIVESAYRADNAYHSDIADRAETVRLSDPPVNMSFEVAAIVDGAVGDDVDLYTTGVYIKNKELVAPLNGNAKTATALETPHSIDGIKFDGTNNISHYGTCTTAGSTSAKTVTINNFSLVQGAKITVKFSNTNTASSITLNISNTGAKTVYFPSATAPGVSTSALNILESNGVYDFVYDGTYWRMIGNGDSKVAITNATANISYPIALSPLTGTTSGKDELYKNSDVTVNPNMGILKTKILQTNVTKTGSTRTFTSSYSNSGWYRLYQLNTTGTYNYSKLTSPLIFSIESNNSYSIGRCTCIIDGDLKQPTIILFGGENTDQYIIYVRTIESNSNAYIDICIRDKNDTYTVRTLNNTDFIDLTPINPTSDSGGYILDVPYNGGVHTSNFIGCSGINVSGTNGKDGYLENAEPGQIIGGQYPKYNDSDSLMVLGKGTSAARANAFRIDSTGSAYGYGAYHTTGADYAEMFEWIDGNENAEDRRGLLVTLEGQKIRLANKEDTYILGAVSACPSIVGSSYDDQWYKMFETDIFGTPIMEEFIIDSYTDEKGVYHKAVKKRREKLNPNYNSNKEYVPRSSRKEWDPIGLQGKLTVIDDGTCVVNGFCKPSQCGIATNADTGFRVMERLDDIHIKVLIK